MPCPDPSREEKGRKNWDGAPLHEGYLYHHESFGLARRLLAGNAEADRAFGGDGPAEFDDPASRIAATLLWLERNMVNLANDGLERSDPATARAILDYFPERRDV